MAHTKEARPSSANGQESTSAERRCCDSFRRQWQGLRAAVPAQARGPTKMHWVDARDALKFSPGSRQRSKHHSDWPKAFLKTNVFLMRGLIGLVKSIVLMGRIYRMDSYHWRLRGFEIARLQYGSSAGKDAHGQRGFAVRYGELRSRLLCSSSLLIARTLQCPSRANPHIFLRTSGPSGVA